MEWMLVTSTWEIRSTAHKCRFCGGDCKASGIVTEEESLTSHAAVIGLRLGIPVIVGVKQATKVIRDGGDFDMQGLDLPGALRGG